MPDAFRPDEVLDQVLQRWRPEVVPLLETFARIPNQSPAFDPDWEAAGHMEAAATLLADWAARRQLPGAAVEVVRLPDLTPTVVVEVPATDNQALGTVLLYGHYDKQPPFDGWSEGRGPWSPVIEGDRLYARGVADDGYALPSALVALESLAAAGGRHGRIIMVVEGSEESGSPHLAEVLAHLADRIGAPDLVIALDSGSPTYDRLWITTSLRGALDGVLTVSVLEHGVHSGAAGAVVPSSFRLLRRLLDRIEDPVTGDLLLPEFLADLPLGAVDDAETLAVALAEQGDIDPPFPVVGDLQLQGDGVAEQALRTAWLGSVAVVGADGLPPTAAAGNVLRPSTSLKLVLRLPPTCDAAVAGAALSRALLADPPSGAQVTWLPGMEAGGWAAPAPAPWLVEALDEASSACFGRPSARVGEGGSIPFMGWLAERFPDAQLLAAGVLGPGSNAHGPDESLHLPTGERITASLAVLLGRHAERAPA
jgi:acetylornithine deacetylase/succinyl-diaminopimelate desuccinylase-like protein